MKVPGILVLFLAISSCLINSTGLELAANGSGSILLEYNVSDAFLRFAQYDDIDSQITLPINEYEFRRLSAISPGLELVQYRSRQDGDMTLISAKLEFEGLEALSPLFGSEYSSTPGGLSVPLITGLADISREQRDSLRQLDPPIAFHFSFSFADPGVTYRFIGDEPRQIERENTAKGLRIAFSYSLKDLLEVQGATLIEFTW